MLLYFKVLSASKSCIDSTPQQSNFLTKSGKPHWRTRAKVYIAKSGGSELLQSAKAFAYFTASPKVENSATHPLVTSL